MGQYIPGNPNQVAIQKPQQVQIISIMTLISGVINIIYTLSMIVAMLLGALTSFGITLLCIPIVMLPGILGIFEIIYATTLMANPPRPVKPSTTIAIMEICCILALQVIGPVVGILALVYYNDPAVKDYFTQINSPHTS
jgi:hypothetical protein